MRFKYVNKTTGVMKDTPYACDRETATIYVNPMLIKDLSLFERKFWIWHEKGHIILQTPNELLADEYAFNKMAGTEWRSLKQMIEAVEHLLDSNNPYHQERIDNLYRLAIEWDKAHPISASTSTKIASTISDAMVRMGELIVLSSTSTAQNIQKKDNTLLIAGLAVAAMFIFSTFFKN